MFFLNDIFPESAPCIRWSCKKKLLQSQGRKSPGETWWGYFWVFIMVDQIRGARCQIRRSPFSARWLCGMPSLQCSSSCRQPFSLFQQLVNLPFILPSRNVQNPKVRWSAIESKLKSIIRVKNWPNWSMLITAHRLEPCIARSIIMRSALLSKSVEG